MVLISTNPATSKEIKSYDEHSVSEINDILYKAKSAQQEWSSLELDFRLECLNQISGILLDKKREYASIMAGEMGKPIDQGVGEIEKCAWLCDYYKENAREFLSDKLSKKFQKARCSEYVGIYNKLKKESIITNIKKFSENINKVRVLSFRCQNLIDGLGKRRVIKIISK